MSFRVGWWVAYYCKARCEAWYLCKLSAVAFGVPLRLAFFVTSLFTLEIVDGGVVYIVIRGYLPILGSPISVVRLAIATPALPVVLLVLLWLRGLVVSSLEPRRLAPLLAVTSLQFVMLCATLVRRPMGLTHTAIL